MARLSNLSQGVFDVIVVGGGIIGAGVARDAAMRGLKVALFEKRDFGWGTTAGSTRLIHGGLRYLEMLDFRLVRLDLRERETLLKIAPHLVKPLEFFLPFYRRTWFYRNKVRLGMFLYDLLSYDKSLPRHRVLSAEEIKRLEPALVTEELQGAVAYYDAQAVSPERLCLENILDASAHGAEVYNYAEVTGALRTGLAVTGVTVRDVLSDDGDQLEVKGRIIVNASGPWFDRVAGNFEASHRPQIRTTKGIHLAGPPLNKRALVLFSPRDERLFFVIPWLGHSWIGTTDTDYAGDPGDVRAEDSDVRYLRESIKPFLPELTDQPIYYSNAGVRALVMNEGSESSVSRLHRIADGDKTGAPNLLSVLGGKITGYRAIAEEVTELVCGKLKIDRVCRTAREPLPGGRVEAAATNNFSFASPKTLAHLSGLYGSRAIEVLQLAATDECWREQLAPEYPDIAAQVIHAVRAEQCVRLNDFMLRRTTIGFGRDQGRDALGKVLSLMAAEFNWSPARQNTELEAYHQYLARTQAFRQRGNTGPSDRSQ